MKLVLVLIVLVETQGHLFRVNSVNEFKMKPGRAEIQKEREPVQSFTNPFPDLLSQTTLLCAYAKLGLD